MKHLDFLILLISAMACFRLAVMLGEDSGPWKIGSKLRSFLKREARQNVALRKSDVHHGIECIKCNSIWLALPVAIYGFNRESMAGWVVDGGDVFLLWMALSGLVILINRAFPKK